MIDTLKTTLSEWRDSDSAGYALALCLGLMDEEKHPFSTNAKHVFYCVNPIGKMLAEMLEKLVNAGVLETGERGYRWNKEFQGSWED